jgi:hypothetical protein
MNTRGQVSGPVISARLPFFKKTAQQNQVVMI